jgi:threonine dehydratase
MSRFSLERIRHAARIIDPVFRETPQFICDPLGDALGIPTAVKIETLNPIRSFKGRGATTLVSALPAGGELACASAGNFGQAMAYACRARGIRLTVHAARPANAFKVERMRRLGATVVLDGEDFDAAKLLGREMARSRGVRFVEDGLDLETIEGAGTMGLEWLAMPDPPDTLVIPLGNGAMFNGVAFAVKSLRPDIRIVAVQAAGAPAMIESWRAGRVIVHDRIQTIADGIGVRVPIPESLRDMEGLVDDAVLVSEASLVEAIRLLHRHAGVVAEPSGGAGIAALLERPDLFRGRRAGTIVCGGNLTMEQMAQWLNTP